MLNNLIGFCLLISLGGEVAASANIARIPVALRQTYNDGTSTELTCTPGSSEVGNCVFRKVDSGEEFTFQLVSPKYRLIGYLSEYWYWPGSEKRFTIAVIVECRPEDLQKLTSDERDNAECRLFLSPRNRELIQESVEITSGDVSYSRVGPNYEIKRTPEVTLRSNQL